MLDAVVFKHYYTFNMRISIIRLYIISSTSRKLDVERLRRIQEEMFTGLSVRLKSNKPISRHHRGRGRMCRIADWEPGSNRRRLVHNSPSRKGSKRIEGRVIETRRKTGWIEATPISEGPVIDSSSEGRKCGFPRRGLHPALTERACVVGGFDVLINGSQM